MMLQKPNMMLQKPNMMLQIYIEILAIQANSRISNKWSEI